MANETRAPFYRVDRFLVPDEAREEFLGRVAQTVAVLRQQDGYVRDFILEQPGPGAFNLVTFVEWTSADVVERVSAVMAQVHRQLGFDRHELMARLGIKAEMGGYTRVEL